CFFFQAEDGIRDRTVTGVQTCALPISMASNVHLYKHAGFDPVRDFAPVAYAGANIICLAVNAELPIKSVSDVIAYAKQNPGKLRSEERRVGKECRARWWMKAWKRSEST